MLPGEGVCVCFFQNLLPQQSLVSGAPAISPRLAGPKDTDSRQVSDWGGMGKQVFWVSLQKDKEVPAS